jgi:hypothetical protein
MEITVNNANRNVTTPDDLMAVLYKDQLESVAKAFVTEANKNGRERVKTALLDAGLLAQLADILDEYVAIGVCADLQTAPLMKVSRSTVNPDEKDSDKTIGLVDPNSLSPDQKMSKCQAVLYYVASDLDPNSPTNLDTIFGSGYQSPKGTQPRKDKDAYEKYFSWFIKKNVIQGGRTKSGVEAFYERYPLIKHAVEISAQNFQNNIITACANICGDSDWSLIFNIFMNKDEQNNNDLNFTSEKAMILWKISSTGSDFHKGGKQVLILTFSNDNKGTKTKKLVYKPADIEMDYRLIGNTSILSNFKDLGYLGASKSLIEIINGFFPGNDQWQLPTYRILPRNPGSGMQEINRTIAVAKSYGYIEFLTHQPELDESGNLNSSPWSDKANSDWITDDKGLVKKFFRQWGRLLAIASLFSLSDLHQGNVIVHKFQPYLIDLEAAFQGPMTGLASTGAFDAMNNLAEPGNNRQRGLEKTPRFLITKDRSLGRESPAKNRIATVNNKKLTYYDPNRYCFNILQGFTETIDKIVAHKTDIQNWLNNPQLLRTIARYVALATRVFTQELRNFYSRQNAIKFAAVPDLSTFDTRGADNPFTDSINSALTRWKNPTDEDKKKCPSPRPNYAIQTSKHNFTDYLNCDVPSYYHRLNGTDLLNARGEAVIIMPSGLVLSDLERDLDPVPKRETYFDQSTWDAVRSDLDNFFNNPPARSDACRNDLKKQFTGVAAIDTANGLIKKK